MTVHSIDTGQANPIRSIPYRIPQASVKLVNDELDRMLALGIVETFRYYLFGRKFKLQTDHNPLVWLNQVKNKNRKLLRWSLTGLQEYDIELEHKCGEKHVNVDALSRMP